MGAGRPTGLGPWVGAACPETASGEAYSGNRGVEVAEVLVAFCPSQLETSWFPKKCEGGGRAGSYEHRPRSLTDLGHNPGASTESYVTLGHLISPSLT